MPKKGEDIVFAGWMDRQIVAGKDFVQLHHSGAIRRAEQWQGVDKNAKF